MMRPYAFNRNALRIAGTIKEPHQAEISATLGLINASLEDAGMFAHGSIGARVALPVGSARCRVHAKPRLIRLATRVQPLRSIQLLHSQFRTCFPVARSMSLVRP